MRCMIDLTLEGETLVCVRPEKDSAAVEVDDELVAAFLKMMGEPRAWALADSGEIVMLFPHQDMPDEVKHIAEQMTTHHLIRRLETATRTTPPIPH
jgi:hypothetical protein